MKNSFYVLFPLAGVAAMLCPIGANAAPLGCGTVERVRAVKDSATGTQSIVVDDFYTVSRRVERIVANENGELRVEILDAKGRALGEDEDISLYTNSSFPSLVDFASSISVSYAGTVPDSVPGWQETWAIENNRGEDENYYYDFASYSAGFSGTAAYHTYPFTCTLTFTLECADVDQVAVYVSSDDNASIEILGQTCSSSLFSPGTLLIDVPAGTTSFPVTVSYENIGGPYALNFSVQLRKRL